MHHLKSELSIYFIRHAESVANLAPHVIGGRSDSTPLSSWGETQAKLLGQELKNRGVTFDHVFCSTLIRARQTAEIASAQMDRDLTKIKEVTELVEFSQGDWEGQTRSEIYSPQILSYINTKGSHFTPPNGESQAMVEHRFVSWFLPNVLNNPDFANSKSRIAIFSHGLTIRCALHWIMGYNDRFIYRMSIDNTSVSAVRFNKDGWWIDKINDTSHLS